MKTDWANGSRRYKMLLYLWVLLSIPAACECSDDSLCWGIQIHNGTQQIEIPSLATSGELVGAMTILPPINSGKRGTLVCRIGGRWLGKRVGPASSPHRHDADCIVFIDLDTGKHQRHTGFQPAPDFVVKSPSGRFFALASSVGWSFKDRSREDLVANLDASRIGSTGFVSSELQPSEVQQKLRSALVGTVRSSVWETHTLRPIWQLRYPNDQVAGSFVFTPGEGRTRIVHPVTHNGTANRFERPWDNSGTIPVPWWAINHEPNLYNYPAMAFTADDRYFVCCGEIEGLRVLDITTGEQTQILATKKECYPETFFFVDDETIAVFMTDGTFRRVRLDDRSIQNELESEFTGYNSAKANGYAHVFPLFRPSQTGQWIASTSNSQVHLFRHRNRSQPDHTVSITLPTGAPEVGITRLEISPDGHWAGINIEILDEWSGSSRFCDSGRLGRFERIDLSTGRCVERVLNRGRDWKNNLRDRVPSVNVSSATYRSSFGACLSLDGRRIIYTVPYRSSEN